MESADSIQASGSDLRSDWLWLDSTHELQEQTYGYDLQFLRSHPDQLASYIDWNQTSAVQELAELREEFSWKPWATDPPFVNRRRIIDESVDALHFIGNILVGVGCTDEEFWNAYRAKQQLNRERKARGDYSAKKGGLAEGSDV